MRARHLIEDRARGQWQWVVTQLPHGVSAQRVLEEIEELTNPKLRPGKKSLSAEQTQMRQTMLSVLDVVRDESGKDAPVRLVFEPKSSRIEPQTLINILLANTSLECNVAVNLVMVGRDGRPTQKPLLTILTEWGEFRLDTVTRRTRFRLERVEDRIHILEGRQQVLLNIDEVIRIIRESDEPKPALIARFALSDRQAEDILEIRLRQLARLEAIKLEQELAALRTERSQLESLLASPSAMRKAVIREIEADAKTYGDERRTVIEQAARAVVEMKVAEEPVTVIVSEKGWVRARQGHGHDWSQFSFKAGDALYGAFEVKTTDAVFAFSTQGRVYSLPVSQLPSARGDGAPITSFFEIEPGSRIEHVFACASDSGVLLSTARALALICQAGDLVGRTRQGKAFMTLEPGDALLRPALFAPGLTQVLAVSAQGKVLIVALSEVKPLRNGGRGVTLMGLDPDDTLQQALVFGAAGVVIRGIGRGAKPIDRHFSASALSEYAGARARKGRFLEPRVRNASLALPRPGAGKTP
jgi:topoisomerase-4 subunit A